MNITKQIVFSTVLFVSILSSNNAVSGKLWYQGSWYWPHSMRDDFPAHFSATCGRLGGSTISYDEGHTVWCTATERVEYYKRLLSPFPPYPYYYYYESQDACITPYQAQEPPQPPSCGDTEGNPCDPATGNKIQTFTDFISASTGKLSLKRTYLSQNNNPNQFAPGWQHNYSSVLDLASRIIPRIYSDAGPGMTGLQKSNTYGSAEQACLNGWQDIKNAAFRGHLAEAQAHYAGGDTCNVQQNNDVLATLTIHRLVGATDSGIVPLSPPAHLHRIIRSDGHRYLFQQINGQWQDLQHPQVSLQTQGSEWLFTDAQDNQEVYDTQGRLQQITTRQGLLIQLQYDLDNISGGDDNPDTLDRVTGPFGRTLAFSYQAEQLISVNTPDGLIQYTYDDSGNLINVTYPDQNTSHYHYEHTQFKHHLTGISDQNGDRYATWDYDDQGRVILSEHADHNQRVQLVYNEDGSTTVTDALDASRTYHFEYIKDRLQVKQITGDRCTQCGNAAMQERQYDSNGFLSAFTDWQGNTTHYETNARGLKTCQQQAYATPDLRMTKTTWHSEYRLPLQIDSYAPANTVTTFSPIDCSPNPVLWQRVKTETYHYDVSGRLLNQTIEAP